MKRMRSQEPAVISFSDIHKIRKIGQGSGSLVFEAKLRSTGLTVAFKELVIDNEERFDKEILCDEGRLLSGLRHPNIILLHGVAANSTDIECEQKPHNLYNLVMEYVPDGNLRQALQKDPNFVLLPWRSRVLIALQVAQALEYMHSLGIIYFDIRTPNVLLDLSDPTYPVAKICDFGLASEKEEDMDFMHNLGFPGRMAPEVAFADLWPITEKADVFTFGVLMHTLVTGKECDSADVYDNDEVHRKFFKNLGHGHPTVPEWCFSPWRELMWDCLNCEAPWRPAFTEVIARLRFMLDSISGALERTESCSSNHIELMEYINLISPLDLVANECLSFSTPQLVSSN